MTHHASWIVVAAAADDDDAVRWCLALPAAPALSPEPRISSADYKSVINIPSDNRLIDIYAKFYCIKH